MQLSGKVGSLRESCITARCRPCPFSPRALIDNNPGTRYSRRLNDEGACAVMMTSTAAEALSPGLAERPGCALGRHLPQLSGCSSRALLSVVALPGAQVMELTACAGATGSAAGEPPRQTPRPSLRGGEGPEGFRRR